MLPDCVATNDMFVARCQKGCVWIATQLATGRIYEGTNNMQRVLIARRLLERKG
jgi:alkylation response protein AidB-like acyl-CoA dehydrogenase